MRRRRHWALTAGLGAMCLALAACSSATPTTSATSTDSGAGPDLLFPDQAVLPLIVYINGVVYDMGEAPARELLDIGQSSLPYAGPPAVTEHGFLVATGESYDATLTLYPADGGNPLVLAHGVGSFALADDGQRVAWAEPWKGPSGNARETTRLVEAELLSGEEIHATTFLGFPLVSATTWGFADVVTFVGDNVLLMTGDGAAATAAVWVPAEDRVAIVLGYGTVVTGNSRGGRVVLSQGDGSCGVIAVVHAEGTVTPLFVGLGSDEAASCWASDAATFSPDGSTIASAGTDGEYGPPIVLLSSSSEDWEPTRVTIGGVSSQYFQPHAIRWLDDHTLVLLAAEGGTASWQVQWGIFRCDTQVLACDLVQPIAFNPTGFRQVALVVAP